MSAPVKKSVAPKGHPYPYLAEEQELNDLQQSVENFAADPVAWHPTVQQRNLERIEGLSKKIGVFWSPAHSKHLMHRQFQYWSQYRLDAAENLAKDETDPSLRVNQAVEEISQLAKALNVSWDDTPAFLFQQRALQNGVEKLLAAAEVDANTGDTESLLKGVITYAQAHQVPLDETRLGYVQQLGKYQKAIALLEQIAKKEQALHEFEKHTALVALHPGIRENWMKHRQEIDELTAKLPNIKPDLDQARLKTRGVASDLVLLKDLASATREVLNAYRGIPPDQNIVAMDKRLKEIQGIAEYARESTLMSPEFLQLVLESQIDQLAILPQFASERVFLQQQNEMMNSTLRGDVENLAKQIDTVKFPHFGAKRMVDPTSLTKNPGRISKTPGLHALDDPFDKTRQEMLEEAHRRQSGKLDPDRFTFYHLGSLEIEDWDKNGRFDWAQDVPKDLSGKILSPGSTEVEALQKMLGVKSLAGVSLKTASLFLFLQGRLETNFFENDRELALNISLVQEWAQRHGFSLPEKFAQNISQKQAQMNLDRCLQMLEKTIQGSIIFSESDSSLFLWLPFQTELDVLKKFATTEHLNFDSKHASDLLAQRQDWIIHSFFQQEGPLDSKFLRQYCTGLFNPNHLAARERLDALKTAQEQIEEIESQLPKKPHEARIVRDKDFFQARQDYEEWKQANENLKQTLEKLATTKKQIQHKLGLDPKFLKLEILLASAEWEAYQADDYATYLSKAQSLAKTLNTGISEQRISQLRKIYQTALIEKYEKIIIPPLIHEGKVEDVVLQLQVVFKQSEAFAKEFNLYFDTKAFKQRQDQFIQQARNQHLKHLWQQVSVVAANGYLYPLVQLRQALIKAHQALHLEFDERRFRHLLQSGLIANAIDLKWVAQGNDDQGLQARAKQITALQKAGLPIEEGIEIISQLWKGHQLAGYFHRNTPFDFRLKPADPGFMQKSLPHTGKKNLPPWNER